jgi:Outer membrane protein beta-barrel domain
MKSILIFFLFVPFVMISQDSLLNKYAGLTISGGYGGRFSSANDELNGMKESFDSLEHGSHYYNLGVVAGKELNLNLSLQAGINFTAYEYRIDTLAASDITDMHFKVKYIELPVCVNYTLSQKKGLTPYFAMGIFGGLALKQETEFDIIGSSDENSYSNMDEFNSFNLGILASLGIQKQIQENYLFRIEANYRQSLVSLTDSPLRRYLFGAGLSVALVKKF